MKNQTMNQRRIDTERKISEMRVMTRQEHLADFKMVSRPPAAEVEPLHEGELFPPAANTKSIYLLQSTFEPELHDKWHQLMLKLSMDMESLLIENLHLQRAKS